MASEWAKAKAVCLLYQCGGEIYHSRTGLSVLGDALDAAKIEGLEEAAKIAESHADHGDAVGDMRQDVCASSIATNIRARIEELQK